MADHPDWKASNVTPVLRPAPDGQYMVVQRSGQIMLSKNIIGPYVIQGPSIYKPIEGMIQDKPQVQPRPDPTA